MRLVKLVSGGILVLVLLGLYQNCSPQMLSQLGGSGLGGEAYEGRDLVGDPVEPGTPPTEGNQPDRRTYVCSSNQALDFGIIKVSFAVGGTVLNNFRAQLVGDFEEVRMRAPWESDAYLLDLELYDDLILKSIALDSDLQFASLQIATSQDEIFKVVVECHD